MLFLPGDTETQSISTDNHCTSQLHLSDSIQRTCLFSTIPD